MENALRKTFKAFLGVIFISGFLGAQSVVSQDEPQIKTGENNLSMTSGNQTRQYLLYIPAEYDGEKYLPLVLLFHGAGGSSKTVMQLTGLRMLADERNFFIAAPQGIQNMWDVSTPPGNSDVKFAGDLIREIISRLNIDQKRIYIAGFSAGAMLSSLLVCHPSTSIYIAAFGAVAALRFPEDCAAKFPVSIIAFHGEADMMWLFPFVEDAVNGWVKHNGCDHNPVIRKVSEDVTQISYGECQEKTEVVFYRIKNGGHTWPDSPLAAFYEKMSIEKTNKDINATNLIWRFFEAHPMP